MKYRIQFKSVFINSDANNILNTVESVKNKVFKPAEYTQVDIIRRGIKLEYVSDITLNPNQYASIDFDSDIVNHLDIPITSQSEIQLDISFNIVQDFYDCINYLESIKSLADNTKIRMCRHFECKHDEPTPIPLDGPYTYMDFDASSVVYS